MQDIIHLKVIGGSLKRVKAKVINSFEILSISLERTNSFSSLVPKDNVKKSKKEKSKTAPSSLFQRQHVDLLLEELIKKFPPQRVKVIIVDFKSLFNARVPSSLQTCQLRFQVRNWARTPTKFASTFQCFKLL